MLLDLRSPGAKMHGGQLRTMTMSSGWGEGSIMLDAPLDHLDIPLQMPIGDDYYTGILQKAIGFI